MRWMCTNTLKAMVKKWGICAKLEATLIEEKWENVVEIVWVCETQTNKCAGKLIGL